MLQFPKTLLEDSKTISNIFLEHLMCYSRFFQPLKNACENALIDRV